jgi:ribulose-5-phosphate 4-epimerase/fuculose-1-phosphate aldolase
MDALTFDAPPTQRLRADLALALRAAAHHGLAEGVCNHFSVELPDGSGRFLLNPRGLLWSEVQAEDIVMVDADGAKLAGRHEVEPTAMFIHGAIHRIAGKACVLHTHMPYATALTCTSDRALDTALSQNAMRFHGRIAVDAQYNGLALGPAMSPSSATMASSSAASAWTTPTTICITWSAPAWCRCWPHRRAGSWCRWTPRWRSASATRRWGSGCSRSCSSRRCGAGFEGNCN